MERIPETNPFQSLRNALAFDCRDWAKDKRDAWVWGVVFGWKGEAMDEVGEKHRWRKEERERLKVLHENFKIAEGRWKGE